MDKFDSFISSMEQLTPLVDDVAMYIAGMNRSPFEHAALCAYAQSRIALGTVLSIVRSNKTDDDISTEECARIMELLTEKTREADEAMQAAVAGQVQ